MKDGDVLAQVYSECCAKLESIGIHIPNEKLKDLQISNRMTNCLGKCILYCADGTFTIRISSLLFGKNVPRSTLENTMIHELLHAVNPKSHHGGGWARDAKRVKDLLGYNITRCATEEESHVRTPRAKYNFECVKCGAHVGRNRISNFVQYPNLYKCANCGGSFKRI